MVNANPISKFDQKPQDANNMTFKEQLDQKAIEARDPAQQQDGFAESLIEKVTETVTDYVPAATKILGDPKQDREEAAKQHRQKLDAPSGPPERPTDDGTIEEFMREQHRSKGKGGDLAS